MLLVLAILAPSLAVIGSSEFLFECCLPDGSCIVALQEDCQAMGGIPELYCGIHASRNEPCNCYCFYACCMPDGSCTIERAEDCEGTWRFDCGLQDAREGVCDCDCPQPPGEEKEEEPEQSEEPEGPRGACCLPGGGCVRISTARCHDYGGIPQGDGSFCTDTDCAENGPCTPESMYADYVLEYRPGIDACENCTEGLIPWNAAFDHVGEQLWVEGQVADADWGYDGELYLNFGNAWPGEPRFDAVISADAISALRNEASTEDLVDWYLGRHVQLFGLIQQDTSGVVFIDSLEGPSDLRLSSLPASTALASEPVHWQAALDDVGKFLVVEGVVKGGFYDNDGYVVLDIGSTYPDRRVVVLIPRECIQDFEQYLGSGGIVDYYLGSSVQVAGTLQEPEDTDGTYLLMVVSSVDRIVRTADAISPRSATTPSGDFIPLGTGGIITVAFLNNVAYDGPGDDIVIEGDSLGDDFICVDVSAEGSVFETLGLLPENTSIDIADVGLDFVRVVRIRDDGVPSASQSHLPGADIIEIRATQCLARNDPQESLNQVIQGVQGGLPGLLGGANSNWKETLESIVPWTSQSILQAQWDQRTLLEQQFDARWVGILENGVKLADFGPLLRDHLIIMQGVYDYGPNILESGEVQISNPDMWATLRCEQAAEYVAACRESLSPDPQPFENFCCYCYGDTPGSFSLDGVSIPGSTWKPGIIMSGEPFVLHGYFGCYQGEVYLEYTCLTSDIGDGSRESVPLQLLDAGNLDFWGDDPWCQSPGAVWSSRSLTAVAPDLAGCRLDLNLLQAEIVVRIPPYTLERPCVTDTVELRMPVRVVANCPMVYSIEDELHHLLGTSFVTAGAEVMVIGRNFGEYEPGVTYAVLRFEPGTGVKLHEDDTCDCGGDFLMEGFHAQGGEVTDCFVRVSGIGWTDEAIRLEIPKLLLPQPDWEARGRLEIHFGDPNRTVYGIDVTVRNEILRTIISGEEYANIGSDDMDGWCKWDPWDMDSDTGNLGMMITHYPGCNMSGACGLNGGNSTDYFFADGHDDKNSLPRGWAVERTLFKWVDPYSSSTENLIMWGKVLGELFEGGFTGGLEGIADAMGKLALETFICGVISGSDNCGKYKAELDSFYDDGHWGDCRAVNWWNTCYGSSAYYNRPLEYLIAFVVKGPDLTLDEL